MKIPSAIRGFGLLLLGGSLLSGAAAPHPVAAATAAGPVATLPVGGPVWHDTGLALSLAAAAYPVCFDAAHPTTLVHYEEGQGTLVYNSAGGVLRMISPLPVNLCGPNGLLFRTYGAGGWRFSQDDPAGQAIDHMPVAVARDGSNQLYAMGTPHNSGDPKMWYSPDGGLTWEPRLAGVDQNLSQIVVAGADARVVYAAVWGRFGTPGTPSTVPITFLRSTDTGRTWQEQSTWPPQGLFEGDQQIGGYDAQLYTLAGRHAPVNILGVTGTFGGGPRYITTYAFSRDGVQTWNAAGITQWLETEQHTTQVAYNGEGVARLRTARTEEYSPTPYNKLQITLDVWRDDGSGWTALPLPFPSVITGTTNLPAPVQLVVADEAPANMFVTLGKALYHSADSGHTWEQLPDFSGGTLVASPTLPLTLFDSGDPNSSQPPRLRTMALPGAGSSLRAPAPATGTPDSHYFPETGHSLAGPFLAYWGSHGGLAQLGYPLTDEIQQVSPVNGRVYGMQYFERAVLERHPENAPPYDILGSLIGVAAYSARYGTAGAPDQHANMTNPHFFAQTGHSLGGAFRAYWESHGGLAQQGYPISDEFTAVSQLDGKSYTMQYFQRAVFEYHPENQGTPYEVLLTQLGRFQLDADWPGRPCAQPPGAPFTSIWMSNPAAAAQLGCRTEAGRSVATAVEPFEHGTLIWLGTGPWAGLGGKVILVVGEDGRYQAYADTYQDGTAPTTCNPTPPAGRVVPQNGFGKLWCTQPGLRDQLGWATAPEAGGPGHWQVMDHGVLLHTSPDNHIRALSAPIGSLIAGPVMHTFVNPNP